MPHDEEEPIRAALWSQWLDAFPCSAVASAATAVMLRNSFGATSSSVFAGHMLGVHLLWCLTHPLTGCLGFFSSGTRASCTWLGRALVLVEACMFYFPTTLSNLWGNSDVGPIAAYCYTYLLRSIAHRLWLQVAFGHRAVWTMIVITRWARVPWRGAACLALVLGECIGARIEQRRRCRWLARIARLGGGVALPAVLEGMVLRFSSSSAAARTPPTELALLATDRYAKPTAAPHPSVRSARGQRTSTLVQDRARLRSIMSIVSNELVQDQRRSRSAAVEQPGTERYDWSKSTRDNFLVPDGSDERGQFTPPFAQIRAGLDHAYHCHYTLSRQREQDELIQHVVSVGEPQEKPWVVFTAGAMGAGKSRTMAWLSESGIFPLSQVAQIDPDLFKAALPEWGGYVGRDALSAGRHTRLESGMLCEVAQEVAMRDSKHVWVDGSLRDGQWYVQVFERLRALHPHYQIAILHIVAAEDVVHERAQLRGQATGRFVPEAEIRDSLRRVPLAVERLRPHCRFVAVIDNSGGVPRLLRWSDAGSSRVYETAAHFGDGGTLLTTACQSGGTPSCTPSAPNSGTPSGKRRRPRMMSSRMPSQGEVASSLEEEAIAMGAQHPSWDEIRKRFVFESIAGKKDGEQATSSSTDFLSNLNLGQDIQSHLYFCAGEIMKRADQTTVSS